MYLEAITAIKAVLGEEVLAQDGITKPLDGKVFNRMPLGRLVDASLPGVSIAPMAGSTAGARAIVKTTKTRTRGAVTHVGTGQATYATSGDPTANNTIVVEITLGGESGVAKYKYSLDNGSTWSAEATTPASGTAIALGLGCSITFTDHAPDPPLSFVVGDTYSFTVVATVTIVERLRNVSVPVQLDIVAADQAELWGRVAAPPLEAWGGLCEEILRVLSLRLEFTSDAEDMYFRIEPLGPAFPADELEATKEYARAIIEAEVRGSIYRTRIEPWGAGVAVTYPT
jgi:hypothetical protein